MTVLTLLLAACCLGPLDERFLLTLSGLPMAVLRVEVRDGVYRYEATHFLDEGETHFARSWVLDERGEVEGLRPEVLWLLEPPPVGCRPVFEERRATRETLCIDERTSTRAVGRLEQVPFTARYDGGRLSGLTFPGAEWTRLEGRPPKAKPSQVFGRGFEVGAASGPWRLEPAVKGARLVTTPVRGTASGAEGRQRCLVLARDAVHEDARLTLVLGLMVEGGRAYPHAWVRRGARHEDPSLLPSDEGVEARWYIELPRESAGQLYLELLDGQRRVVGPTEPGP